MRFLSLANLTVALPLAALLACSGDPGIAEPTRQAEAPIIHGVDSDDSQNAVVLIGLGAGGGWYNSCSGTLIAPNLVVTARHCVSESGPSGCALISKDNPPDSLRIYTGKSRTTDWINHDPDAVGKALFVGKAGNLCSNDIALIVLDHPLISGDVGLAPIRIDAPPNAGDTFTAVGWGVTELTGDPGIRGQRPGVVIDTVGPNVDTKSGERVLDKEFYVGESICHGDSGGPALSTTTGAVLGVVSRGGNSDGSPAGTPAAGCVGPSTRNIYEGLWGFKDLITEAFTAAGYAPWLEGQPDPRKQKAGAKCSKNEICVSNVCVFDVVQSDAGTDATPTKSKTGTCAQPCDDGSACATGFDCTAYAPSGPTSDAAGVDAGPAPMKICTKHVDTPAPAPAADGGGKSGGCSASRAGSDGSGAVTLALGALALVLSSRRRAPR
ncbi:MAG: hypothetical protein NVS3B10_21270 [Polyangiales bacterium]